LNADLDAIDTEVFSVNTHVGKYAVVTAAGNLDVSLAANFEVVVDSGGAETFTLTGFPTATPTDKAQEIDIIFLVAGAGGTPTLAVAGGSSLVWANPGTQPVMTAAGRHWVKVFARANGTGGVVAYAVRIAAP
jgi:hypothetical protein